MLLKVPEPLPSEVFVDSETVGFWEVLQTTPLTVTGEPPSELITPPETAEFEVTAFVKPGRNTVALEVYRYSDGSYLEDQDMFRYSGIFRDVTLWAMPKDGIWDFAVKTAKEKGEGRKEKGVVTRHSAHLDGVEIPTEVVEIVRKVSSVNLKGSRVIVAGGAGVGSKENFALLHDLAAALGGAVGGSRAAVDLGYCEHERQIGQTGVTVRPALMISCGISGAVQHLAGMQDSQKIIAINTDKDAPIFKVAHYGIVGDLNVVIPKLIRAIRNKG